MPEQNYQGLGPGKCRWHAGCGKPEVDGLEYCVQHVPDDLLEEAEEATGTRRCRHNFGQPDGCRQYAVTGTVPPQCKNHGANQGSESWKNAQARVVEGKVTDRLQEIMQAQGDRLMSPTSVGDPLSELLDLAAEMGELRSIMREQTAELIKMGKMRYANAKVGEQLRYEVILYERAIERFAKILIDISKLNIEQRLAGVQKQTADMLERAVDAALQESGIGLDGITGARKAFRRHLKVVQGEMAG